MASNNIIIDTPTKINADKQDTKDTKPPNTTTDNQPSPNPPPTDRPGWAVECNMMEFVDGSGVKHKIHLPKGTMKRACQLLVEENWDELVKFPVYNGQGYTEDDWIRVGDEGSDEASEVNS